MVNTAPADDRARRWNGGGLIPAAGDGEPRRRDRTPLPPQPRCPACGGLSRYLVIGGRLGACCHPCALWWHGTGCRAEYWPVQSCDLSEDRSIVHRYAETTGNLSGAPTEGDE